MGGAQRAINGSRSARARVGLRAPQMGVWNLLVSSIKSTAGHRFQSMATDAERASTNAPSIEETEDLKRPVRSESDELRPLKVKRLSSNATLPVRASAGAAGYDLCAAENCVIEAHTRRVVKTDLSMEIPPRHYGRVAPRSGLSFKFGIDIAAGVIDSDYRGAVGIVVVNNGSSAFEIKSGDRVAQLLLERVNTPAVEEVDELDVTVRGSAGFGSTGKGALGAK